MDQKQEIEQVITRNLSGEATYEDIIRLSEWLSFDDANKEMFLKIKKYWDAEVSHVQTDDILYSYNKLLNKIQDIDAGTVPVMSKQWIKTLLISVAAMLAGIVIFWAVSGTKIPQENYTCMSGNGVSEMVLPDGTKVSLNKNSTLYYSGQYDKKNREVRLKGEAYFDVEKDPSKPFIVNVEDTRITALGTAFNVNNYTNNSTLSITLVEGSIRFENGAQNILLQPGQQLLYNIQTEKVDVESIETDVFTAWKDHLIKYRSLSFEDLCRKLEDLYGVDIVIESDHIKDQIISGSFENNLSLDQILDLLKKNLSFRWSKEEKKYFIK